MPFVHSPSSSTSSSATSSSSPNISALNANNNLIDFDNQYKSSQQQQPPASSAFLDDGGNGNNNDAIAAINARNLQRMNNANSNANNNNNNGNWLASIFDDCQPPPSIAEIPAAVAADGANYMKKNDNDDLLLLNEVPAPIPPSAQLDVVDVPAMASPPAELIINPATTAITTAASQIQQFPLQQFTTASGLHQPPQHSDDDSVCADIDRWAGSLEDGDGGTTSSRASGSCATTARLAELEAEQERMSEAMLALSTQFAQIQLRIQQIAQAPTEQRNEMFQQLQKFASHSCMDFGRIKCAIKRSQSSTGAADEANVKQVEAEANGNNNNNNTTQTVPMVRQLIGELRIQLTELEQLAWQNGQLDELPLSELRARQRLVLDRVREKMRLRVQLVGPEAERDDEEQFRRKLDEGLDQAMEPLREKDQLVLQLRTQIVDLERYVQLLQQEVFVANAAGNASPAKQQQQQQQQPSFASNGIAATGDGTANNNNIGTTTIQSCSSSPSIGLVPAPPPPPNFNNNNIDSNGTASSVGLFSRLFGGGGSAHKTGGRHHFERNELKHTLAGNHYGDQRAEMELAVHELVQVMERNQILAVDREDRAGLSVEELGKVILEGAQEAILASVRKRLCPALRALLEHGMCAVVAPASRASGLFGIGCFRGGGAGRNQQQLSNNRYLRAGDLAKFEGRKLAHIWDVLLLFLEASRALEMRDAVVGQLSDAFKLDSVAGKTATSKQICLSTIEHIHNSHSRLRRSQDSMWKAFVCAALNRNRLPAWIRIIFRSDQLILTRCYHSWSYVARTGVEDIRPLLEGLHRFNFDLPVDLAIRPFEHIKEAFD